MIFKRLLSAACASCLLLTAVPSAVAEGSTTASKAATADFTDIDGHWAYDAILRWSELGVVKGSEGLFRPNDPVTRAELAVILDRVMRYQTISEESFDDLEQDWHKDAILKLRAAGVLQGDEYNRANPSGQVTREAAVTMIARAFLMDALESELPFADADSVSDWARGYVGALTGAGFIRGRDGNIFDPKASLTRAEAVTILDNMVTACFYEPGSYDYRPFQGLADFVIVASDDVKILNFDIGGNIILTENIDPETVRFSAVNHYGKILQHTPDGAVRHLKASAYIVPINEHLAVNTYDTSLFVKDEKDRMTYADESVETYFGIDVSSWQGTDIDWHKLKEEGVYFVFVRAGYRGYQTGALNTDANFKANVEGALEAGIKVGVYFFSQALNAEEAQEEARYVLDLIRGYDITFPVVFDWETINDATARTNKMDTEDLCQAANVFCNTVAEAGYIPMVYCNQSVSLLYYELSRIQSFDFWYAEYKSIPTFYYDFQIWQYGATGHFEGVPNADVDVNISFVDYSKRQQ